MRRAHSSRSWVRFWRRWATSSRSSPAVSCWEGGGWGDGDERSLVLMTRLPCRGARGTARTGAGDVDPPLQAIAVPRLQPGAQHYVVTLQELTEVWGARIRMKAPL